MQKCDKQNILLPGWQSKAYCKQEATRLAKQNIWQTRSYTVGKIKHVVSKKLHAWHNKTCWKQEVTQLAKKACYKQETTRLAKHSMLHTRS